MRTVFHMSKKIISHIIFNRKHKSSLFGIYFTVWLRYGLQHSDLHPVLPTPMSWSQVLVRGSKNLTAKGANLLIFMIFSHEKSQLANFEVLLLRLYCLVTVTWGLKKYHSRPKHEWHIYKCYICYHMLCYIPIYLHTTRKRWWRCEPWPGVVMVELT